MKSTPKASSPSVRKRMTSTRQRDTPAELALRSILHGRGLRYRVDKPVLKGMRRRADVVFPTERVAVFVDGCFWHGCPEHGTTPKTNRAWWVEKLRANQVRDRDTTERLLEAGWAVVRAWEHEDAEQVADRVQAVVLQLRRGPDERW